LARAAIPRAWRRGGGGVVTAARPRA